MSDARPPVIRVPEGDLAKVRAISLVALRRAERFEVLPPEGGAEVPTSITLDVEQARALWRHMEDCDTKFWEIPGLASLRGELRAWTLYEDPW